MTRTLKLISAVALAGVFSAASSAETLTFKGLEYSGTLTGSVTYMDSSNHTHSTGDIYIGKLKFSNGSSTFATLCADLGSVVDNAPHDYDVSFTSPSDSGIGLAGKIAALNFNSALDPTTAGALQLAVWDALYEGGAQFDANSAKFKVKGVDNSVLTLAATYYADGYNQMQGSAEYFSIAQGCGGQSQLTVPAPEPASMAALGFGLIGLIARRRRARR